MNAMYRTQYQQQTTLARLSSGSRINSAADDPAGLVASLLLNSDLTITQAAWNNADRAEAMMNVADGAMSQISSLVSSISSLTVELANSSGLTDAEKQAKQIQIDSAVDSIDRLVNSTTYNGKKLLDGTYGINTTGVDAANITDVNITSRPQVNSTSLSITIVSAAQKGQVSFAGTGLSAANPVTIEVTGNLGSNQFSFVGSASIATMAASINADTASTGVSAIASSNVLYFRSQHYGKDEFVQVDKISGTFNLVGGVTQDSGVDALATVNGQNAGVHGNDINFNVGDVRGTATITESFQTTTGANTTFNVTGGGAAFLVSPSVTDLYTIGINNVGSTKLGNGTLGYLYQLKSGGTHNPLDHPGDAQRIANLATTQVATARANIGSFEEYTVGSMKNMLSAAKAGLSSAISQITDTNYAEEMANATRLNALFNAQISILAMIGQQSHDMMTSLFS